MKREEFDEIPVQYEKEIRRVTNLGKELDVGVY